MGVDLCGGRERTVGRRTSKSACITVAMADEEKEKDEKEEKEEKEEEEEEEDDEDDDDGDDGDDDGDHDDHDDELIASFSEESKVWARQNFKGNVMYARFYDVAKDRSPEDLKALNTKRTWQVQLSNIKFYNNFERKDPFVRFNIGWDFELRKVKEKVRKQDKDGKLLPREYKWIPKGSMGKEWYTNSVNNVARGKIAEFHTSLNYVAKKHWSYFDLYDKCVHVEVWDMERMLPNEFIARAKIPMVQICTGEMAIEFPVFRKERMKKRMVDIDVGRVSMTLAIQEVCDYSLKFVNWGASLRRQYLPNETRSMNNPFVEISLEGRNIISSLFPVTVKSRSEQFVYGADDDIVFPFFKSIPPLSVKGTRVALEKNTLVVKVYDKIGILPGSKVLIGRGVMPLYGASGGRAMKTRLCWDRPRSMGKQDEESMNESGEVFGNIDVFCQNSPLWREFSQTGEMQPAELRIYAPYWYCYLGVTVVEARNLIAADVTGTSDPYFTVEWAGMKKRTKTVMMNCDPSFDETLFFHIPAFKPDMPSVEELLQHPYVKLCCWDFDESGISQLLGTTKIFLSDIAAVQNPTNLVLKLRESDRHQFKPTTVQTRQFKKMLPLEGLGPGIDSFVRVAAFFLGPLTNNKLRSSPNLPFSRYKQMRKGDLYEPNLQVRKDTGTTLLRLPEYNERLDARVKARCYCFPPMAVEEVSVDAQETEVESADKETGAASTAGVKITQRKVCPGSLQAEITKNEDLMCDKLNELNDYYALPDYEHIKARQKRFLDLACSGSNDDILTGLIRGMNMEQINHFLPTFLVPIPPPRSMIDAYLPRLPHELKDSHGHSELDCIVCVDSQKPNTCIKLYQMVKWTVFVDPVEDENIHGEDYGGRKAWCEPNLYFEMRRADVKSHVLGLACLFLGIKVDAYICIGTIQDPATRKEKPHVWLMTRESTSSECAKEYGLNDKPDPDFKNRKFNSLGAVKFWELTSTTTPHYSPLPNRWEGRDDAEEYRIATSSAKRKVEVDTTDDVHTGAVRVNESDEEESEEDDDDEVFDFRTEEDMLNPSRYSSAAKRQDVSVGPKNIFQEGAGVDGDWGRPTQQDVMEGRKLIRDREKLAKDAERRKELEALLAKKAASKSPEYIARMKWLEETDSKSLHYQSMMASLPYKSLHVCFNHKNLWVNAQEHVHPLQLSYDFQFGMRGGWIPAIDEGVGDGTVLPFMTPEALVEKLTEEKIAVLQNEINQILEAGIENAREAVFMKTRLANEEVGPLLQKLLTAKQAMSELPKILKNGWDKSVEGSNKWIKGSRGHIAHRKLLRLQKKLHQSIPEKYSYRLGFATMSSVDGDEIRSQIISDEKWTETSGERTPIHLLNANGKETFCVTCQIVALPSKINFTRVALMAIYPIGGLLGENDGGS